MNIEITSESPKSKHSTQSTINPLTLRCLHSQFSGKDTKVKIIRDEKQSLLLNSSATEEQVLNTKTSNWKPRDMQSSSATVGDSTTIVTNNSDGDPKEQNDHLHEHSNMDILNKFENLRVKSKRGRPRKFKPNVFNKNFKLPRRKANKAKGEGLQQLTHFFLNDSHDEADAIYETGLLMGLLPETDKEASLTLIRSNLAS